MSALMLPDPAPEPDHPPAAGVAPRIGARAVRGARRPRGEVEGEVLHTAADGNGPVNALDRALRKALAASFPALDGMHLVDYKVRIIDGDAATTARTRVVIESSSPADSWSTVGSDSNIIATSVQALIDSFEFGLWKSGAQSVRRHERHFTTTLPATRAARSTDPAPVREGGPGS